MAGETELHYGKLLRIEVFWKDNYDFLFSRGYQLRPRFRPGWTPSWLGSSRDPRFYEDSNALLHDEAIDAVRLRDGREVFIKRIEKNSSEMNINMYLASAPLRADPTNHAVPMLDYLLGPGQCDFIVMPVLRDFSDPPFKFVDETLDFIQQSLEGLIFLHRVGVAHRDCSKANIMFDATGLYPDGFHPYIQHSKRDGFQALGRHLNRADLPSGVRYYFIDFGISTRFTDPSQPRLVTGRAGPNIEVPELSDTDPYDPFKTDVFILGNVYKTCLTEVYSNLSFLKPLVYEMTRFSPHTRPSAEEALSLFHTSVQRQRQLSLRWTLLETNITRRERVGLHLQSILREVRRSARAILGWPTSLIILAAMAVASLVYGPRSVLNRIRGMFRRTR